ncbi:hypothetical protein [Ornithinimicrobium sp. INDO-MA30-4]|uniref:hypothetical protein n=1 Tax=Ornithinimicrobium sp. INDO-MA30-4 TaxID=2908651 RepID=UPI001F39A8A1|nr:hypothetical protein [Ornithinimicrobium sp. INDO-MA30-4]UJH69806.1 hypothetical protein L0A91_11100 [Ornithinimicrobium sp. INDO-MA30-4]
MGHVIEQAPERPVDVIHLLPGASGVQRWDNHHIHDQSYHDPDGRIGQPVQQSRILAYAVTRGDQKQGGGGDREAFLAQHADPGKQHPEQQRQTEAPRRYSKTKVTLPPRRCPQRWR